LKSQLEADRIYLSEEIKQAHDYENIIGDSDVLKYTLLRAEQVDHLRSETFSALFGVVKLLGESHAIEISDGSKTDGMEAVQAARAKTP
jgi:hypothetical protein